MCMKHGTAVSPKPERLDVLGIPVTCFTSYSEAVEYIVKRIKSREKLYCVAINPMKVCSAVTDVAFKAVVDKAELHICDGVGAAIAVRLVHGRAIRRITGVQLCLDLIEIAERDCLRVFFLGADPKSNELAVRNLRSRHPGLEMAGQQHGYFEDDALVVDAINASNADILFVAMGSPKQEYWMARYQDKLTVPFMMGVGGTFDVISGKASWAPAFFRRTGTEFVYRFCMQPRRLKIVPLLMRFVVMVTWEAIRLPRLAD